MVNETLNVRSIKRLANVLTLFQVSFLLCVGEFYPIVSNMVFVVSNNSCYSQSVAANGETMQKFVDCKPQTSLYTMNNALLKMNRTFM